MSTLSIRTVFKNARFALLLAIAAGSLNACGGGGSGGSTSPPTSSYTVGGSVTGLAGSGLVLQLNGGSNLAVAAKASNFSFSATLPSGTAYAVSVMTQPSNPAQSCTVSGASGTITSANVTAVMISCKTDTYQVGGSISGLSGTGLVLLDNAGDSLSVAAGATTFSFATQVPSGGAYAVTVKTQPSGPAQVCTVSGGSGTVGSSNVSTVSVACKTSSFQVGGSLSGLTGTGLVLQDNGGDDLAVAGGAGTFTFATALVSGSSYSVSIKTQPINPSQLCTVAGGSGTVTGANVTTVAVSCVNVGRFVFVANSTDGASGDVSAFTVNPQTGALAPVAGGAVAADGNPSGIVVDRSGQFVYVSNRATSDVELFYVDSGTGALSLHKQFYSPGTAGASIVVAPSNQYLFVGGYGSTTGSVFGFSLDSVSGALTAGATSPVAAGNTPFGVAVDPTSQLLFATATFQHYLYVYSIGSGGALTQVPNSYFYTGSGPYGVAVSPTGGVNGGFLYTADNALNRVSAFAYDATGNLTELTQQGSPYFAGSQPEGIAIDPTGKYLYLTNYGDGTVSAFAIDPASGGLTAIGSAVATGNLTNVPNPGPADVKVDPSGHPGPVEW